MSELALLRSPWHALLPAAMALSRLMEGEMDRALAIAGLTAREFAALLEIRTWAFSREEHLALRATAGDGGAVAASDGGPELAPGGQRGSGQRRDRMTQRELGERLRLTRGATSELLGRLQRLGLIARGPAAGATAGRRGRPGAGVKLTCAGDALLCTAAEIAMRVYDEWARRLANHSAGTSMQWARANGLKRWLTESLAALNRPGSGFGGQGLGKGRKRS